MTGLGKEGGGGKKKKEAMMANPNIHDSYL